MNYYYNDGGRSDAAFRGRGRDCVVRSISILYPERGYRRIHGDLKDLQSNMTGGIEKIARGVYAPVYHRYLTEVLGASFTVARSITYLNELTIRDAVVIMAGHVTALKDGVVNDTWNSSISKRTKSGSPVVQGWYER